MEGETTTYQVRRYRNGRAGVGMQVATGVLTLAEAAEIALRLMVLQEHELGGQDEFTAMPEGDDYL